MATPSAILEIKITINAEGTSTETEFKSEGFSDAEIIGMLEVHKQNIVKRSMNNQNVVDLTSE